LDQSRAARTSIGSGRRIRTKRKALPLHGLPFAVKDNIDVGGMPATAACKEFARTPTESAIVVDRLDAAGVILVGKTNRERADGERWTLLPYAVR
jgi:allophanate hydrolase